MTRRREVRCFKDDTVMDTVKGGYFRCPSCGLLAEPIHYDYEKVKADFESILAGKVMPMEDDYEVDPHDGSEKPWGHLAPKWKRKPKPGSFESEAPERGPVRKYKLDA